MRVLLVDDEPLARAYLQRLLTQNGVEMVGEAEDATTALEKVADLTPEVVFLDIQMPGPSGLQLAEALGQLPIPPLIVFATGYSEHALSAFEHAAVDYLLKPIAEERLRTTLTRLQKRLKEKRPPAPPLARLAVKGETAIRLLAFEEILCCTAREKKVFVRVADGTEYRVLSTLSELENRLPPERFYRIHDSYIVPLERIVELIALGNHEWEVRLSDGRRAPVGRTRYAELRQRLGL